MVTVVCSSCPSKSFTAVTHTSDDDVVVQISKAGDKVEGSVVLPFVPGDNGESFGKAVDEGFLGTDKSRPILVHCRSGKRAGMAIDMLHAHGFVNAVNGCNSGAITAALKQRATAAPKEGGGGGAAASTAAAAAAAAVAANPEFASDADVRVAVASGAVVVDLRGIEEGQTKGDLVPNSLKVGDCVV